MIYYERYISLKHLSGICRNQHNVVPSMLIEMTLASIIEALADACSHWFNINRVSVVYSLNSSDCTDCPDRGSSRRSVSDSSQRIKKILQKKARFTVL